MDDRPVCEFVVLQTMGRSRVPVEVIKLLSTRAATPKEFLTVFGSCRPSSISDNPTFWYLESDGTLVLLPHDTMLELLPCRVPGIPTRVYLANWKAFLQFYP